MGALYLLLPISLVLVVVIGIAFWWAIFSGQFDDADEAARSILDDDDTTVAPKEGGKPGDTL
ncbi:cbb3-type cytochrome oxidase assembly protein CcoS [Pusillimonas minor]|uniref:Cbb3-type cytochrome oxidase assembly protein CcoS n=1 Tax=Pusillimonas minor TaxID=2697024 RepID=A0A842HIE5_9BURK|nr:cbb3-type cytochrome oxidase assembly protein CcoS [Pusillimonas minor]MBC2768399.1 cbb3-type cytochrome oxidase assembly protein CcoS [Pusillimonas minor]